MEPGFAVYEQQLEELAGGLLRDRVQVELLYDAAEEAVDVADVALDPDPGADAAGRLVVIAGYVGLGVGGHKPTLAGRRRP